MRVPPRPPSQTPERSAAGARSPAELRKLGEGLLEVARQQPLDPEPQLGVSRAALSPLRGAVLEAATRLLEREREPG